MIHRNTKERILIASEYLLARRGPAVSTRAIANAAGVNVAAVNYHFGTKDYLIELVFRRRFAELDTVCCNELRSMYDAEAGRHAGFPVSRILRTYLQPFFADSHNDPLDGEHMALLARAIMDPDRGIRSALAEAMKPSREMLLQMLREALPDLPEEVAGFRFFLARGALGYTLAMAAGGMRPDGLEFANRDRLVDALVCFLSSAFEAPSPDEALQNSGSVVATGGG